jgi:bifunctional enzyme CysN/CysC
VHLTNEIDISRGDFIVRKNNCPQFNNELEAILCWFSSESLRSGRSYLMKLSTKISRVKIENINYRLNIKTLHHEEADQLFMNEIGRVFLKSNENVIFDSFAKNRNTGSFILIDEITKNTVAAGTVIDRGKRRNRKDRMLAESEEKHGAVLWFTGLSGSGKSTIANQVFKRLKKMKIDCERLDGDSVRKNLTSDLGFSPEDRNENIKRVSYVAGILGRHGVIVLATFISPYFESRKIARKNAKNFVEIFVDAPLKVCEARDTKGFYKKARNGELKNFTGLGDKYEEPESPDIHLHTNSMTIKECVDEVMAYLDKKVFL